MESGFQISVPIKTGTKKIRKRRELDALVSYSNSKRSNINRSVNTNGKNALEKLIRTSTDEQEEYDLEKNNQKLEKHRVRNCVSIRIFVPIIIVMLLFGFVNWLIFDLKQQFIAYRQKIEEVSVICQILPEEMQKWHEKSSLLEKNQSTIYEKINEIQISIESLKNNFTKFAARADVQTKYTKDDKFVADLGAKLEDVANDMAVLKNHFTVLQNTNTKFQESINKLETRFSEISDHIPEKNKDEEICLEKIQNLQTKYEDEIKSVTANISTVNDTLTQKAHILNEELSTHKSKLDDLFDKSANITSHVTSIENDWTKYRQQIIDSATKIDNFENKMYDVANKTSNFEKSLQKVLLYYTSNNTIGTNISNSTNVVAEHTTTVEEQTINNKTGDRDVKNFL